jgi:Mg-chelatase subunit ChlD
VRRFILLALLALPGSLAAADRFLFPQEGSQPFGVQTIEVDADDRTARVEFFVDGSLVGVDRSRPFSTRFDFGDKGTKRLVEAKLISPAHHVVARLSVRTAALRASEELTVDLVEVPLRIRAPFEVEPKHLSLTENGAPQRLLEVRRSRGPQSFVFVVDRSLSMDRGKLDAARRAIAAQVARLRDGDEASIVFFNHRVGSRRPVANAGDVEQSFAGVVPSGGTSLRDALAGIDSRSRTTAVVISDGDDRNSMTNEEATLLAASRHNLSVHSILLGRGSAATFLEKLASRTGGSLATTDAPSLGRVLGELFAEINSRHVAVYQSTNHSPGWRTISVKPLARGLSVASARKGYQP